MDTFYSDAMTIDTHSAFKTTDALRQVVAAVQKTAKELHISPLLSLEHVRDRMENEVASLLNNAPNLLKELKVKLRAFTTQSHIDVLHDTKEHCAVLVTVIFRKGGEV